MTSQVCYTSRGRGPLLALTVLRATWRVRSTRRVPAQVSWPSWALHILLGFFSGLIGLEAQIVGLRRQVPHSGALGLWSSGLDLMIMYRIHGARGVYEVREIPQK
jgi:hypothetical protein